MSPHTVQCYCYCYKKQRDTYFKANCDVPWLSFQSEIHSSFRNSVASAMHCCYGEMVKKKKKSPKEQRLCHAQKSFGEVILILIQILFLYCAPLC